MTKEMWKDIKDFPKYQISNLGRVRSSYRLHFLALEPRILRPSLNRGGYYYVILYEERRKFSHTVHRLVLEAFVGLRPPSYQANHKDGIKVNNELSNLEWITQSENALHAFRLGLQSHAGEASPFAKLKNNEVWLMKKLLYYKIQKKVICRMFKISYTHLCGISAGRIWAHIEYEESRP